MPTATNPNSLTYKVRHAVEAVDTNISVTALSNFRFDISVPSRLFDNKEAYSEKLIQALGEVTDESFSFVKVTEDEEKQEYVARFTAKREKASNGFKPARTISNAAYVESVISGLLSKFGEYKGHEQVNSILHALLTEEKKNAQKAQLQAQFSNYPPEVIERMLAVLETAAPEEVNTEVASEMVQLKKSKNGK